MSTLPPTATTPAVPGAAATTLTKIAKLTTEEKKLIEPYCLALQRSLDTIARSRRPNTGVIEMANGTPIRFDLNYLNQEQHERRLSPDGVFNNDIRGFRQQLLAFHRQLLANYDKLPVIKSISCETDTNVIRFKQKQTVTSFELHADKNPEAAAIRTMAPGSQTPARFHRLDGKPLISDDLATALPANLAASNVHYPIRFTALKTLINELDLKVGDFITVEIGGTKKIGRFMGLVRACRPEGYNPIIKVKEASQGKPEQEQLYHFPLIGSAMYSDGARRIITKRLTDNSLEFTCNGNPNFRVVVTKQGECPPPQARTAGTDTKKPAETPTPKTRKRILVQNNSPAKFIGTTEARPDMPYFDSTRECIRHLEGKQYRDSSKQEYKSGKAAHAARTKQLIIQTLTRKEGFNLVGGDKVKVTIIEGEQPTDSISGKFLGFASSSVGSENNGLAWPVIQTSPDGKLYAVPLAYQPGRDSNSHERVITTVTPENAIWGPTIIFTDKDNPNFQVMIEKLPPATTA